MQNKYIHPKITTHISGIDRRKKLRREEKKGISQLKVAEPMGENKTKGADKRVRKKDIWRKDESLNPLNRRLDRRGMGKTSATFVRSD
jgi:hypothetical protein